MAEKNKNNNSLVFADNGYLSYIDFSKLSFADKLKRRLNIAKAQFDNGSLAKAGYALVGGYDPENPRLSTGDVPNPGMRNPAEIVNNALLSIKLMETINNYWKNLGRLKIRLGGNGKYASGILTKPGTAPTTFNGLNINYITSPKGGNVTHKFYTDLGSEYILTRDGFARRIKSSHANTGGADSGLHEWNKGATRFLDSDELGWSYQAWTDKTKPLGFSEKDGIISLVTKDNGKWRYVMRSELRPNAIKNGTIKDGIILSAYTTEPKIGKWMLEYGTNPTGEINWFHPGSQVAFIEGLKQGGKMNILEFLKNGSGIHIKEKNKGSFTRWCGGNVTEECIRRGKNSSNPKIRKKATFALNARRWKHKEGGIIKALEGTNFFLKAGNWISNNKDLVSSVANTGLGIINNIKLNKAIDAQIEANEKLMEVNKQQAFMDNYKKALGMLSDRSDIVNRNKAWLIANSLNYSDDELLNKNLLLQQSRVGVLDSLGGLSTDILNTFSNKKSSSNNPPSDSYFGSYVKTLFKNPGTFNSDGSFNTSLGAYKFENGKYLKVNTSPLSNLKFNI